MGIDHSSLTDQVDYFNDLTDDQVVNARRIVAGHSEDGKDCSELLEMLGIHPTKSLPDEVPRTAIRLPAASSAVTEINTGLNG